MGPFEGQCAYGYEKLLNCKSLPKFRIYVMECKATMVYKSNKAICNQAKYNKKWPPAAYTHTAKNFCILETLNLSTCADSSTDDPPPCPPPKKVSGVRCHMSGVRCHMSCVTCHLSHVTCRPLLFFALCKIEVFISR